MRVINDNNPLSFGMIVLPNSPAERQRMAKYIGLESRRIRTGFEKLVAEQKNNPYNIKWYNEARSNILNENFYLADNHKIEHFAPSVFDSGLLEKVARVWNYIFNPIKLLPKELLEIRATANKAWKESPWFKSEMQPDFKEYFEKLDRINYPREI